MNKRGISEVVIEVLLILLSILAIIILWQVLKNVANVDADTSRLTVDLDIKSASFANNMASVAIQRNIGEGNITKLAIKFQGAGESYTIYVNSSIKELELQTFYINLTGKIATLEKITVAPILVTLKGREVLGPVVATHTFGSSTPPTINPTNPIVNIKLVTPSSNINVARYSLFNVVVNVSCSQSDCGSIDVSLDPSSQEILKPNSAGDLSQWQISGATPNYACVSEASSDNDATFIHLTDSPGRTDLYNFPDLTPGGTISSVTVHFISRIGPSSWASVAAILRNSGGTTFAGTYQPQNIDQLYHEYTEQWTINPFTLLPWTIEDINGLQIGVGSYGGVPDHGEVRVTQVWTVVDYTSNTYCVSEAGIPDDNGEYSVSGSCHVSGYADAPSYINSNGKYLYRFCSADICNAGTLHWVIGSTNCDYWLLGAYAHGACPSGNCGHLTIPFTGLYNEWGSSPYAIVSSGNCGTVLSKNLISTVIEALPFYTNENPKTTSLNNGESEIVVFSVNATGDFAEKYSFFAYANKTSQPAISSQTSRFNVTIT